jgi:hypothetical protein
VGASSVIAVESDTVSSDTTVNQNNTSSEALATSPSTATAPIQGVETPEQPGSGPTFLSRLDTASVSMTALLVRELDSTIKSVTFNPNPAVAAWTVKASNGASELKLDKVEIALKAGTIAVPANTVTAAPVEESDFVLPPPPGGAADNGTTTIFKNPAELNWPVAFKPGAVANLQYPLPADDIVAFLKQNTDAPRVTFEIRFLDPDGAYLNSGEGVALVLTQNLQIR